jgi:hypothetical protein
MKVEITPESMRQFLQDTKSRMVLRHMECGVILKETLRQEHVLYMQCGCSGSIGSFMFAGLQSLTNGTPIDDHFIGQMKERFYLEAPDAKYRLVTKWAVDDRGKQFPYSGLEEYYE